MDGQSLMKSTWLKVFSVLLLVLMVSPLVLPVVKAAPADEFVEPFHDAFNIIVSFFKLDFLPGDEDTYAAVVRFALWLVTFTIIQEILTKFQYFSNKSAKIIAFAFSAMAAIFMPKEFLLLIGQTYAALFAMVFIGAIVFTGFKLGHWIENQGGPGSKPMFIIIMIVLISLIQLINSALEKQGKVPDMGIFSTIYYWYGIVATIAVVWTLISKGLLGGGAGGGGGGLFGRGGKGAADTGDTDPNRRAAQKTLDADRAVHDIERAEKVVEEIIQVERAINEELIKIDTDALGVLERLSQYLDAIAQLAKQLQDIGGAEIQEKYQKYLIAAISMADRLLEVLTKEDKLADQETRRINEEINITHAERRKMMGRIRRKLRQARSSVRKKGKAKLGAKSYQDYLNEAIKIDRNLTRILNARKRLEKKEKKIMDDASGDIHKEVKEIVKLKKALDDLKTDPEPKKIRGLKGDIDNIRKLIEGRIEDYREELRKEVEDADKKQKVDRHLKALELILKKLETMQVSAAQGKPLPDLSRQALQPPSP